MQIININKNPVSFVSKDNSKNIDINITCLVLLIFCRLINIASNPKKVNITLCEAPIYETDSTLIG
jgi:hypothetical protein